MLRSKVEDACAAVALQTLEKLGCRSDNNSPMLLERAVGQLNITTRINLPPAFSFLPSPYPEM